jgi:hypothetical protein
MRLEPRTFGDGGGVSRRDHAVRAANESNAGAGGLSSIDAALRENEGASRGRKDRPVDNLFRTMDIQPNIELEERDQPHPGGTDWSGELGSQRSFSDPYHPMNDINSGYNDGQDFSEGEADEGLGGDRYDPLTSHFSPLSGSRSINNMDAAAYSTSRGIPVSHSNGYEASSPASVTRSPKDDYADRHSYDLHTPSRHEHTTIQVNPSRSLRYGGDVDPKDRPETITTT